MASADDATFAPEVRARLTAEHRTRRELPWADSKYHNHHLEGWLVESAAGSRIEVVRRPPGSEGDVGLPRRWVVERTVAWLGRYRRNSRDDVRSTGSSEAMNHGEFDSSYAHVIEYPHTKHLPTSRIGPKQAPGQAHPRVERP